MMKHRSWSRIIIPALFAASACSATGSAPFDPHYMSDDTTTPTTPPIGVTPVGSGNDMIGMTIGMKLAPNNAYTYYFHKAAEAWSAPCTITNSSSTANRDILCIMEAKELDLAYNGVTLKVNVPSDMCSYVAFDPYFFYSYQAGQGPDYLSYDVRDDGSVIPGSVVAKYGGPSGTDASSVVSFVEGNPKCLYNYIDDDGPDCCYGKYSGMVRKYNTAAGSYQSSPISGKWGGKAANCLAGPAVEANAGTDINGFPLGFIYYTEGTGISTEYVISARLGNYVSSVGVANYFSAGDYPLNNPNMPTAFLKPLGDPALGKEEFQPNPYYTVWCYDRTMEVKARIRLLIQEWNLDAEFEKKGTANANPDSNGIEANFPNYPENDYLDWKDFGYRFPQKRR